MMKSNNSKRLADIVPLHRCALYVNYLRHWINQYCPEDTDLNHMSSNDTLPLKFCPRCGDIEREVFCSQSGCINLNILKEYY